MENSVALISIIGQSPVLNKVNEGKLKTQNYLLNYFLQSDFDISEG